MRQDHPFQASAQLAPIEMLLPLKWGLGISYHPDSSHSYELNHMRAIVPMDILIVNVGKITESRTGFLHRSYGERSSFAWIIGASYETFEAKLGNKYLDYVPTSQQTSLELMSFSTLAMTVGIGNRFAVNERFAIGVDWIKWHQPLVSLGRNMAYLDDPRVSPDVRNQLDSAMRLAQYFPRFTLFEISLVYGF
jgi:hypothetical protein